MPLTLPHPEQAARIEVERLTAYREILIDAAVSRVLADCPFIDPDSLLGGLENFHRERMAKVPSRAKFPESPAWVEHLLAVDQHLQRLAGLTDREMAVLRSLGHYLTFRGFAAAKPVTAEKCRIAYLSDSDVGPIHIKNVDDPCTYYKPEAVPTSMPMAELDLVCDGVGSGLHIDDEPEEIFPLNAVQMMPHYAREVPGAVDFLQRYKPFWGGGNVVLRDRQNRSAAIEKCSHNFIEVFHPGADGRSHCSGMACRDPQSPQGLYQRAKRQQYLTMFDQPADGPDQLFWNGCDRAEQMLADGLGSLGKKPKLADVIKIFTTPWPQGLRKTAVLCHPKAASPEYTLVTRIYLPAQNRFMRFQRDEKHLKMPTEPEVFQF